MSFMTISKTLFSSILFIISRLVFFLKRRQSSEEIFEGATKQACNYAEMSCITHAFLGTLPKFTQQLF